jgi:DNA polymerase III sliding clamp (beta) subunit (PCNA family)
MLKVEKESEMGELMALIVQGDNGIYGSLIVPTDEVSELISMLEAGEVSERFQTEVQFVTENFTAVVVGNSVMTYGNLMLPHTDAQRVLDSTYQVNK